MLVMENTGQCEGAWRLYWASVYELRALHTRYIQVIGSPHPRADDHCCGGAGMHFYVAAACLHHHLLFNKLCECAGVQVWCPVYRKSCLTRCAKNPLRKALGPFFLITSSLSPFNQAMVSLEGFLSPPSVLK